MTTIAYRDGVLAADSLRTFDDAVRDGYCRKIWRVGRVLGASCGSAAAGEAFRNWVAAGMVGQSPYQGGDEGNGIVIAPNGIALCFGKNGPWRMELVPFALGSGEQFAKGAMAHGASAVEAVKVAIQFDARSGGEIHTLRVAA